MEKEIPPTLEAVSDDESLGQEATSMVDGELKAKQSRGSQSNNHADKLHVLDTDLRDPDAFRIPEERDEGNIDSDIAYTESPKGDDDAQLVNPIHSSDEQGVSVTDQNIKLSSSNKDKIMAFVKSISVISMSALQLVNENLQSSLDDAPIICLHPTFLSQKTGEDILAAFDEIMITGKFLSGPIYNSWNEAVQSLASGEVPSLSNSPAYMLLLLRFQLSVMQSYQHYLNNSDSKHHTLWQHQGSHSSSSAMDNNLSTTPRDEEIEEISEGNTENNRENHELLQETEAHSLEACEDALQASPSDITLDDYHGSITLLPSLFKRVKEIDEHDLPGKIISDFGSFFEISYGNDVASETQQNEGITRIGVVTDQDRSVIPEASDLGIDVKDSAISVIEESFDEADDTITPLQSSQPTQVEESREDSSDMGSSSLELGPKKNYRKKKRKKVW
jgi:hypothetical protein